MEGRSASRRAFEAGIRGEIPLVVYQWHGWGGFLIDKIARAAIMIRADPADQVAQVIERLPPTPGAFLFHVNCSVTGVFPLQRRELITALHDRGWTPCNERAVDISKRRLQDLLGSNGCRSVSVARNGAPDDPLVVKSNYNYGGLNERELPEAFRAALGIERLPPTWMDSESYRVMPRAEVADEWWSDPSLTVERFVGNEAGHYFRISFAGRWVHMVCLANADPIKKVGASTVVATWKASLGSSGPIGDPVANQVLQESSRAIDCLEMDFGALDVVLSQDDNPFVIDVNTTPWLNTRTYFPGYISHLSGGVLPDRSLRDVLRSRLRFIREWWER